MADLSLDEVANTWNRGEWKGTVEAAVPSKAKIWGAEIDGKQRSCTWLSRCGLLLLSDFVKAKCMIEAYAYCQYMIMVRNDGAAYLLPPFLLC